jgi:hypothetical protein
LEIANTSVILRQEELGMTSGARDSKDHRQRMLDHQESQNRQQEAGVQPADRQMKIPLIGEIRRTDPTPAKRARKRTKTLDQPQFRDV